MKFKKLILLIILLLVPTNITQAKATKDPGEELEKALETYEKKEAELEKQQEKIDALLEDYDGENDPENEDTASISEQGTSSSTASSDGGFPYKVATAIIISLLSSLVIWPMKKWYDNKPNFNLSLSGYYSEKSEKDNMVHIELEGKIYNNSNAPQHLDDIVLTTNFAKNLNIENQINSISVGHIGSKSSFKFNFVKEIYFEKELPQGIEIQLDARLIDQGKLIYQKNLSLYLLKKSIDSKPEESSLPEEREHQSIESTENSLEKESKII